jgi:hypothetical protein
LEAVFKVFILFAIADPPSPFGISCRESEFMVSATAYFLIWQLAILVTTATAAARPSTHDLTG